MEGGGSLHTFENITLCVIFSVDILWTPWLFMNKQNPLLLSAVNTPYMPVRSWAYTVLVTMTHLTILASLVRWRQSCTAEYTSGGPWYIITSIWVFTRRHYVHNDAIKSVTGRNWDESTSSTSEARRHRDINRNGRLDSLYGRFHRNDNIWTTDE